MHAYTHTPTHAFAKFTHTHHISMQAFCSTAKRWMLMHPDNIIAVHCKGGKGRTGMMISAFLAFEKQAVDIETKKLLTISGAAEALAVFDRRRTLDPTGLSQCLVVCCSVLQRSRRSSGSFGCRRTSDPAGGLVNLSLVLCPFSGLV